MCLVPLSEGCRIDLDDGGLGQGVCADEFVVGGVVGDSDDTNFAGNALGAPTIIAGIEAESAEFAVAATSADQVDAFGTNTSACRLATLLESSRSPMSEGRYLAKG